MLSVFIDRVEEKDKLAYISTPALNTLPIGLYW